MMHSICIIDDAIPAVDKLVDLDTNMELDANTLKYLLRDGMSWSGNEQSLKNLIIRLVNDRENWNVTAFRHPNLFMNYIKTDLIRPEIIIYDWEFHTSGLDDRTEKENELFNIVSQTYCLLFVYSGADKADEINEIIESKRFEPFKNRIFFNEKADTKSGIPSDEKLISEVENQRDTNFSFRFGRNIKQKSIEAVEEILLELGKATLNDVSAYFRLTDDTKRDLVDFIGERFRNRLNAIDLEELPSATLISSTTYDENLAKRLWSYRLYFHPNESDNIVRRGDVVYKVSEGQDKLYLIISADCDLNSFWHKNMGNINLVTLIKLDPTLKERLKRTIKHDLIKEFQQPSLLSRIGCMPEGPFVLPFIEIDGTFINYLVFPKEITNIEILAPATSAELKKERLKYSHWNEYKRILTVSEPFLSPMIEHITKSLSGYGVPDYPPELAKTIHNISKAALE